MTLTLKYVRLRTYIVETKFNSVRVFVSVVGSFSPNEVSSTIQLWLTEICNLLLWVQYQNEGI